MTVPDDVTEARLRPIAREMDEVYALGGGQFLIFLANTSFEGGSSVSFRVCNAIAGQPLTGPQGEQIYLTVDCGVAEWTSASEGLPELISEAHESLVEHRAIRLGTVPIQAAR